MNVPAIAPLSPAIPELFRRRGGPPLQVLREAVDAEWFASAHPWPLMTPPGPADLTRLDALARATGWAHLLDVVGGIGHVAKPEMVTRLLEMKACGLEEQCRFWTDCLFGATLQGVSVRRGSSPSTPPRAHVVLSGMPPGSNRDVVFRALARLVPAYLIFTPQDLVHIPSESKP